MRNIPGSCIANWIHNNNYQFKIAKILTQRRCNYSKLESLIRVINWHFNDTNEPGRRNEERCPVYRCLADNITFLHTCVPRLYMPQCHRRRDAFVRLAWSSSHLRFYDSTAAARVRRPAAGCSRAAVACTGYTCRRGTSSVHWALPGASTTKNRLGLSSSRDDNAVKSSPIVAGDRFRRRRLLAGWRAHVRVAVADWSPPATPPTRRAMERRSDWRVAIFGRILFRGGVRERIDGSNHHRSFDRAPLSAKTHLDRRRLNLRRQRSANANASIFYRGFSYHADVSLWKEKVNCVQANPDNKVRLRRNVYGSWSTNAQLLNINTHK